MTNLVFPDGQKKAVEKGTLLIDAIEQWQKGSRNKVIAAKVNGTVTDTSVAIDVSKEDLNIEPIETSSNEGLEVLRHTTAHVLAQAVKSLYPDVQVTIGPIIKDGFYYDFDSVHTFTPDDLKKIEKKMKELIKKNEKISREEVTKEEAKKYFKSINENYKIELIDAIEDDTVSLYKQGDFTDLCRGPHLPSTGRIKAFKLTHTAGAYWRGDENNKMLQRVYGTAFATKEELKDYLELIEEAKKRDHRKLGKELDLFSTSEDIGAGLTLWHPKGALVREIIENFWRVEHRKGGYDIVYTPHVAKVDLWQKSGHWDFYRESLYSPMDVDGQEYIVKPMNCPFHIEIYKSNIRSYRDLPIRMAELGTVYRYERSGALHGLLRVRGFTQDDAHIFMTPDQLLPEIKKVLDFTIFILKSFGFNEYEIYLSTKPEKYVGSDDNWELAENALKTALEEQGLDFEVDPGEGVFYGPKIDIKIKDSLGRSWQCSTVQVDFNLPERFNIEYRSSDGETKRPIMIHRALMGSLERFFGCLVEHYAGDFPLWLAPVQASILTVTDRSNEYGKKLLDKLRGSGIRVELDDRNEKLGFKIREGQLKKFPYMLVIGDQETENETVTPRSRKKGNMDNMTIDEFINMIKEESKP